MVVKQSIISVSGITSNFLREGISPASALVATALIYFTFMPESPADLRRSSFASAKNSAEGKGDLGDKAIKRLNIVSAALPASC